MNSNIKAGEMLQVLARAEKHLPEWLMHPEKWGSLLINHENPILERLWRKITFHKNPYRLCLHRLRPSAMPTKAFYHRHPWPLAIKIIEGSYEMTYGFGEKPAKTEKIILQAGDSYEMIDPEMGHAIIPLVDNSLTLMVIGSPWSKSDQPILPIKTLTQRNKDKVLKLFQGFYSFSTV